MELYCEEDFAFRFRFTKASMLIIMSDLQLKNNTDQRGAPLPPLLKVLITLRFYGTGTMQTVPLCLGDHASHMRTSVSQICVAPQGSRSAVGDGPLLRNWPVLWCHQVY